MVYEPGQFIQLGIPGIGEAPFSIASYSKDHLLTTIRIVGNVTRALSNLKKGDSLTIRGPYGKGYPLNLLKGKSIIIIGGGCGVAPLKGVIDYIEQKRSLYKDIFLFLGYRSPADIIYTKDLQEWKKKFDLFVTVDKNPGKTCFDGKVGFITEAIKSKVKDSKNKAVFICGPPIMIQKTIEILKNKGFSDTQIFVSTERLMHCGYGVCCHCMIHEKFTCLDGPVFRYDQIKDFKND